MNSEPGYGMQLATDEVAAVRICCPDVADVCAGAPVQTVALLAVSPLFIAADTEKQVPKSLCIHFGVAAVPAYSMNCPLPS
jgi:hypothetical protein